MSAARIVGDAAVIARREWLRYRRDRAYWIGQLAFPLLFVVLIGLGLDRATGSPVTGRPEAPYSAYLAAGMLALIASSGAVGGGFSLIQDRESGFLRALCVAPLSATGIVLGKIAARIIVTLVLLAVLVIAFSLLTEIAVPHPLAVLVSVVAITVFFTALGVGLSAWLHSAESFRLIAALVTVPLYWLSGMFYPVEWLPWLARSLSTLNPLTYAVDLMRYGLLGSSEHEVSANLFGMGLLVMASLPLAIVAYRRGVRQ